MGRLNPSRETKFSGTHGDRGMFIFPVQLTTSRIGNLTRLIHTLLYVMTIHTYIHTLTTRQPMVEFYLLTFPRFPLRKREHKSYFGKNRTHDFNHSGDEATRCI